MTQLIRLADDVIFEVEGDANVGLAAGGGQAQAVQSSIDDAIATLHVLVDKFGDGWERLSTKVAVEKATVTVKLGVTASGRFFVAQGEASANLEVQLTFAPKAKALPQ